MLEKKNVSLPFSVPVFSTFHHSAVAGMIFDNDPNARIQMLNQSDHISCSRKFLSGYTSPEICVLRSGIFSYPNIDILEIKLDSSFNHKEVIKNMLEDGRYVYFMKVDDYYIPHKSWYGIKHMLHDGIICGSNDIDDTYSVAAYDENWVFRLFKIPRDNFEEALEKSLLMDVPELYGCKATNEHIELDIERISKGISNYINSDLRNYPVDGNIKGYVIGAAVNNYIAMYIDKLIDGSVPYDKMDWRVIRAIWEFRVCMLERIQAVESKLGFNITASKNYSEIVSQTNRLRIIYAICHKKRKDSSLLIVRKGLEDLVEKEKNILAAFVAAMEDKT